jgi:hypothetical protein
MTEKIVEEIHAIRRKTSEECDYDFQKLGEYYMQLQAKHPERVLYNMPETERVATRPDTKSQ